MGGVRSRAASGEVIVLVRFYAGRQQRGQSRRTAFSWAHLDHSRPRYTTDDRKFDGPLTARSGPSPLPAPNMPSLGRRTIPVQDDGPMAPNRQAEHLSSRNLCDPPHETHRSGSLQDLLAGRTRFVAKRCASFFAACSSVSAALLTWARASCTPEPFSTPKWSSATALRQ